VNNMAEDDIPELGYSRTARLIPILQKQCEAAIAEKYEPTSGWLGKLADDPRRLTKLSSRWHSAAWLFIELSHDDFVYHGTLPPPIDDDDSPHQADDEDDQGGPHYWGFFGLEPITHTGQFGAFWENVPYWFTEMTQLIGLYCDKNRLTIDPTPLYVLERRMNDRV
jgi:hypothetical protein